LGVERSIQRHTVAICRTCPRDTAIAQGHAINATAIAHDLRAALTDEYGETPDFDILMVHCLGACTRPCAAALTGPGKWRLRFERLSHGSIAPFIGAVRDYRALSGDALDLEWLAPALRSKVGARSPPPPRPIDLPEPAKILMGGLTS
jgi:predicted metal-binding protein